MTVLKDKSLIKNQSGHIWEKMLTTGDVLVIAFGAMVGWGWVVSTGEWIDRGGVLGAVAGFLLGGIMVFFVGLTYAELTSAIPETGGESIFSQRAFGTTGSFICTWGLILGYIGVVCFEACAFPTIVAYIFPSFLKGYLYTVAGFKIYASWLILAIISAIFMTGINILGTKMAANFQLILTLIIGFGGILLIVAAAVKGDPVNLAGHMFLGNDRGDILRNIMRVAVISPFFYLGFDVIPQAVEEINVDLAKVGRILLLSIILGAVFYSAAILSVGYLLSPEEIDASYYGTGLVSADAMAKAFNTKFMADALIVGGMCGIITTWNSFIIGASRALFSMSERHMLPEFISITSKKYKTPSGAIIFIGALTLLSLFFGRKILVWVMDAGTFGCCVAYCIVALSFLKLRKTEPELHRPFKVRNHRFVGVMAALLSAFMVCLYVIPGSGATFSVEEWIIAGGWILLGIIYYFYARKHYGSRFGVQD